jgi:hypothetical protein
MRTKALLGAAILAAGLATSMAQNVYSLNVVGYYNVTVPAGKLKIIANQLNTTNMNLSAIIPATAVPEGSQVFKWTGGGFGTIALQEGGEWDKDLAMPLGDAFFFMNNAPTDVTLTFVGEVAQAQGSTWLTNNMPATLNLESSMVPQAGELSAMGIPAEEGDQIYFWNYQTASYSRIALFEGGEWDKSVAVDVGEGFFRRGSEKAWARNFTVPQ